jgi:hypothetical protein
MGTEYELLKPEKNERFELGKGTWAGIFEDMGNDFLIGFLYSNWQDLHKTLLSEVADSFSQMTLNYFEKVAKKIIDWCGEDTIQFHNMDSFNELHWEDSFRTYDCHKKKFPYTGSRFPETKK